MTKLSRGVSSVGRARRSQRRGRGFESLTLHHYSHTQGPDGLASPAPVEAQAFLLPGRVGQALWYHVLPSLMWFPFRRMRCLQWGHVPIAITSSGMGLDGSGADERSQYNRRGVAVECLFCRIVAGESPADMVFEDDAVVAFRDIYPKAPVHILIVPRRHIASISEM